MPGESKTEKPTAKRRRDERKKGNVFTSHDVTIITSLFGAFVILRAFFPTIVGNISEFMIKSFSNSSLMQVEDADKRFAIEFAFTCLKSIYPLLIVAVVIPILAVGTQTKFLWVSKNLGFHFGKLNPFKGIKKIFSIKNLIELLKNSVKVVILGYILYTILRADFIQIRRTMDMDVSSASAYLLNLIYSMVTKVVMVFVVIAVADFFYQWWDYERKLKMSKQEVKEEFKQTEGDPQIKGKIRSIQRQRAMSRMMQAVPKADVVIKNPTHFAVALKYDIDQDAAPTVVAKGQDELAKRIIAIAEQNGVYVIENRPLARALYAACALNSQIPEEYYGAVAEILVYVFRMNNKWSGDNK